MTFEGIFRALQQEVPSVTALLVVGPDGELDANAATNPRFELESFGVEYAMLLRIARRASEDAGTGEVGEHIVVSDKAIIIARRLSFGHYAIAVSAAQEQLGRLRFELKRTAWILESLLKQGRTESRTA